MYFLYIHMYICYYFKVIYLYSRKTIRVPYLTRDCIEYFFSKLLFFLFILKKIYLYISTVRIGTIHCHTCTVSQMLFILPTTGTTTTTTTHSFLLIYCIFFSTLFQLDLCTYIPQYRYRTCYLI